MTPEKVKEVVGRYRHYFESYDIPKSQFPLTEEVLTFKEAFAHCHWMLGEIEKFLEERRIEKAMRWLGFVQGVFWIQNRFTIEELANHNRS